MEAQEVGGNHKVDGIHLQVVIADNHRRKQEDHTKGTQDKPYAKNRSPLCNMNSGMRNSKSLFHL